jgi:hypothetical protein
MSSKLEPIREITVSDEMLFPDVASLTGVVERKSAGGFVLRAARTGKVVDYSATDTYGSPLQGKYLRTSDGAPHASPRSRCYFCVTSGGATYCTEVLCPDPPT